VQLHRAPACSADFSTHMKRLAHASRSGKLSKVYPEIGKPGPRELGFAGAARVSTRTQDYPAEILFAKRRAEPAASVQPSGP
jgi:hypothetical protein